MSAKTYSTLQECFDAAGSQFPFVAECSQYRFYIVAYISQTDCFIDMDPTTKGSATNLIVPVGAHEKRRWTLLDYPNSGQQQQPVPYVRGQNAVAEAEPGRCKACSPYWIRCKCE